MSFDSWLQNLRSNLAPRPAQRQHRRRAALRPATHRLRLEPLEERRLLAFSPATSLPVGAGPAGVVSADFNNDGHIDLASVNTDTVSLLPGDGLDGFGEVVTSAAASSANNTQNRSVAVGDFNNDGNLDLTMVNDYALDWYGDPDPSNGVSVLLGNGDGSFQAPLNVRLYQGTKATSVAVGDFNNDGTLDLAVASTTDPVYPGDVYIDNGLASVLLGNGDGSFRIQDGTSVDISGNYSPTPSAVAVAVADFNGDGNQDFVVGTKEIDWSNSGYSVDVVAMLLGDGQGNIASVSKWRLDHGWSMAAGDLDGDGDADLVTVSDSQVHVRLGNGVGGFDAPPGGQSYAAGPGAYAVVLGDFNRDGALDIATANYIGDNVSVLRGRGDGTFQEAEHFASGPRSIAIAAGDFNGDGWLDLAMANVAGNTVSVLQNDQTWSGVPLPSVTISNSEVTEGDAGTVNATFTVTLSRTSAVNVTVHYVTADGTATAGSDYVAKTGDVTIPAGQLSAMITVTVIGDRLIEPYNEHFVVNLSNATNATIADGEGFATILDDEPRISISNTSVTEGNSGTVNATFTVSLSKASTEDVTVHYQTADGTAAAGSDYVATSGEAIIPAGGLSATITVPVIGDRALEAAEVFQVYLSSPTNASIADGHGIGTIVDNEPRVSINNVSMKEGKGKGTTVFTFTVTLSAAYDQPVTMSYSTANGSATAGSDYAAKSGTLTFAPGETIKTITVVVQRDKNKESNETFYLDLFGLSSNALFTKNRGIGTILNDD
jgi:hypothetical protein